jgi:tRNA-Thr(GGU) m(6)t(6)A37 methyltransferase TsaA
MDLLGSVSGEHGPAAGEAAAEHAGREDRHALSLGGDLSALIGADPDQLEPGISKPSIGRFVDTQAVEGLQIKPVGRVESPLSERADAPKQGSEGAPEAWIVFEPDLVEALRGIAPGDEVLVLTWLDRGDREVLQTRPRDDPANPLQGVFNTRSPDRPNPIGLHPVTVVAIEGSRMLVSELEALDGTPVIDVKPVI